MLMQQSNESKGFAFIGFDGTTLADLDEALKGTALDDGPQARYDSSTGTWLEPEVEEPGDEEDPIQEPGDTDNQTPIEVTSQDDGFGDLDSLLQESVALQNEAALAKAAKARLRKGGQSRQEMLEDQARIAAWEAAHEWSPVANVAHFEQQLCKCGSHNLVFRGLLMRETHRHMRDSQRWRAITLPQAGLPKETVIRNEPVEMCELCLADHGYDIDNATAWTA